MIEKDGERPSWIVGGFGGAGGMLIPLSDRWVLRPDIGFSVSEQRTFYSDEHGSVGISVLRRFEPSERGWVFTAARYGVEYAQTNAERPSWSHTASFTVGALARLRGRVGVMAEAGLMLGYLEQRMPSALNTVRSAVLTQRVGLIYRWKDRER